MGSKLYVGNLPYEVSSDDLTRIFSAHGSVTDAMVTTDRDTGRSRGFGFVQMESDDAAEAAIKALNGTEEHGRALTVNHAKPRTASAGGYRNSRRGN